jgi:hypothetical protein
MTPAAKAETIGHTYSGASDRIDGYQVITIDGVRVGTVTSTSEHGLVVRCGSWPRRSLRALPVEQAVIRDIDRTVLMLASPEELQQLSKPAHAPSGDAATAQTRGLSRRQRR